MCCSTCSDTECVAIFVYYFLTSTHGDLKGTDIFYLLTHTSTITMTTSDKRTADTPPVIGPVSSEDVSASVRHSAK